MNTALFTSPLAKEIQRFLDYKRAAGLGAGPSGEDNRPGTVPARSAFTIRNPTGWNLVRENVMEKMGGLAVESAQPAFYFDSCGAAGGPEGPLFQPDSDVAGWYAVGNVDGKPLSLRWIPTSTSMPRMADARENSDQSVSASRAAAWVRVRQV